MFTVKAVPARKSEELISLLLHGVIHECGVATMLPLSRSEHPLAADRPNSGQT